MRSSNRIRRPHDGFPAKTRRPVASWPLVILAWIAVISVLYVARDLVIPVVLALLVALLLRPLLRRLRRLQVPDVISSFVLVTLVAILFAAGLFRLAGQGREWPASRLKWSIASRPCSAAPDPSAILVKATAAIRSLTQLAETSTPMPVEVHSPETAFTVLMQVATREAPR